MQVESTKVARCQHVRVNGTQCGSPALRERKYCFFHQEWRPRRVRMQREQTASRARAAVALPVLEDANSVQVALMQVLRLLLAGQIEHRTASLLLYGLQTAASNVARTRFEPERRTEVVIDRKKVAATPLGGTPWSEEEEDPDDDPPQPGDNDRMPGGITRRELRRELCRQLGLKKKKPATEGEAMPPQSQGGTEGSGP
jgi:hypothetical protein